MWRKTLLSSAIILLFSGLVSGQHEEAVLQKRNEERIQKDNEKLIEIYKKQLSFQSMSQEEILKHQGKLFDLYHKAQKEKGLRGGPKPYGYYYKHIHPERLDELREAGIKFLFSGYSSDDYSYKDYVLYGEVVVVGIVRKFVYHPEMNQAFHTSVIVTVEDYLRDDFGLADTSRELIIKLISGPLKGDKWVTSSDDPDFQIGNRYLLFLTRYGYLTWLLDSPHFRNVKDSDLQPNEFVLPTDAFPIIDSRVEILGENLDIEEVKTGIRQIVDILDVENFFNR